MWPDLSDSARRLQPAGRWFQPGPVRPGAGTESPHCLTAGGPSAPPLPPSGRTGRAGRSKGSALARAMPQSHHGAGCSGCPNRCRRLPKRVLAALLGAPTMPHGSLTVTVENSVTSAGCRVAECESRRIGWGHGGGGDVVPQAAIVASLGRSTADAVHNPRPRSGTKRRTTRTRRRSGLTEQRLVTRS